MFGKLKIGWAKGDITPQRKTFVQGQFHARITDEVRSPLTATALAMEVRGEGGRTEQAVFLSCDLAFDGFKPDLLKALDGKCTDLDLRKITVNGTHTHNAPSMKRGAYPEPDGDADFMNPDEYRGWLADQLAEIVSAAWEARHPAGLSRGFGYAVVGRCRRAVYADGSALMYGNTQRKDFSAIEACDDHAVNMLFTHTPDGELTGILVNLACPSQCDESGTFFSADFWHDVRLAIADRYGDDVHLLPQCAPAGDLSPHLLTDQSEEKDLRARLDVDDKGIIARRIMSAIDEGLATASPRQDSLEFVHHVETFRIPRLMVTDEEYELEKRIHHMSSEELAQQPFGFRRVWPFGLVCDLIARYEQQEDNPLHDAETHLIRIGDVAFATNPFELFVDYGITIRSRSQALQTFLVQLADGSDNGFYLPTERALGGGHYSALTKSNWVGPEGGKQLVEKTVSAINALFQDEEYPRTR